VLVSSEFEGHRDFFYTPPTPQTLFIKSMVGALVDERPISTDDAKIWLAEIPFVRLREGLPAELLNGKASYTDAVLAVQKSLPDNTLVIDFENQRIICGGIPVALAPRELAFYAWHAQRQLKKGDAAPIGWKDTMGKGQLLMEEYFDIYCAVHGGDVLQPDYLEARKIYVEGFDKDEWAGLIHHVKKRLYTAIGKHHASQFEIKSIRIDPKSNLRRNCLDYPVERISFIGGGKWGA